MTVLDRILAETRVEIERRKREMPIDTDVAVRNPCSLREALDGPGIAVIAEFKRRSPSAGKLREPDPDIAEIVQAYERGGASALSVLTEGPNFDGSLADIGAACAAVSLASCRSYARTSSSIRISYMRPRSPALTRCC